MSYSEKGESSEYPLQDENFRRYREEGEKDTLLVREYEPTLMTTCGTVPVSKVRRTIEKNKEADKKRIESLRDEERPSGVCPFKGNSMNRLCDKGCAWFGGAQCVLIESSHEKRLEGTCPISHRNCEINCVFWSDEGCIYLNKMVSG